MAPPHVPPFPTAMTGASRPPTERLWTSREVCAYLGIGKNAPSDLVSRGLLPAMRIGRRLRFDPGAVRAFALRHETGPCSAPPLQRGATQDPAGVQDLEEVTLGERLSTKA